MRINSEIISYIETKIGIIRKEDVKITVRINDNDFKMANKTCSYTTFLRRVELIRRRTTKNNAYSISMNQ